MPNPFVWNAQYPNRVFFENLQRGNHKKTSDEDEDYNCIAYAYGVLDRWFWPEHPGGWLPPAERDLTVAAFEALFATSGYVRCPDGSVETGTEKIAIFAKNGIPTHAARQLESGEWVSKMGEWDDIVHEAPFAVEGRSYGVVALFMGRPRRAP